MPVQNHQHPGNDLHCRHRVQHFMPKSTKEQSPQQRASMALQPFYN